MIKKILLIILALICASVFLGLARMDKRYLPA